MGGEIMNDDELWELQEDVFIRFGCDESMIAWMNEACALSVCISQQFWGEFFSEVR
jgi:hypothetical protein